MKRTIGIVVVFLLICSSPVFASEQGVAIQRVITNTRSELGQLANSGKAQEISGLMKKFDQQYTTWNETCGKGQFDPTQASDACKAMADQMRETGIELYGKLSEYLPDVAARYEQGANASASIVQKNALNGIPSELYQQTRDGIFEPSGLENLSPGDAGSPFAVQMDDIADPTDDMFAVLEKLVPDYGRETPGVVRAGNTQINMLRKAKKARFMAQQFEKAKFALESQREYGDIIFGMTKAVEAMPGVLGLQYTGTSLSSRPNQKVLEYYREKGSQSPVIPDGNEKGGSGFDRRQ